MQYVGRVESVTICGRVYREGRVTICWGSSEREGGIQYVATVEREGGLQYVGRVEGGREGYNMLGE